MLMDKLEVAIEPLAESPAPPPDALCPDPPKSKHQHHRASGHAHEAGYGAVHYLKLLASQYVCYNSGLDEGSSESFNGCTNKPPVEPLLSEEVLWPSASLSQPATHLQMGEPPIMSLQQSYCPEG